MYHEKLKKQKYRKHERIVQFLQSILTMKDSADGDNGQQQFSLQWSTRSFTTLCAMAVKEKDVVLMEFCQEVANKEWRLLVDDCYSLI